jgi:four helix bundle protein
MSPGGFVSWFSLPWESRLGKKTAESTGFLVDQLNRAALSIATNLADGNGRFTKPDRRNFFTIARGSAQECVPLLEIARRRGLIKDPESIALKERLEIIAKMISGLINGLDKRDG